MGRWRWASEAMITAIRFLTTPGVGMSRNLSRATVLFAALALIVSAGAAAKPHVLRAGSLFLRDDGGISPSRLPKHSPAPVSAHIAATIGTTDGSHPPAVEMLDIDFDKNIELNAKGLPA